MTSLGDAPASFDRKTMMSSLCRWIQDHGAKETSLPSHRLSLLLLQQALSFTTFGLATTHDGDVGRGIHDRALSVYYLKNAQHSVFEGSFGARIVAGKFTG